MAEEDNGPVFSVDSAMDPDLTLAPAEQRDAHGHGTTANPASEMATATATRAAHLLHLLAAEQVARLRIESRLAALEAAIGVMVDRSPDVGGRRVDEAAVRTDAGVGSSNNSASVHQRGNRGSSSRVDEMSATAGGGSTISIPSTTFNPAQRDRLDAPFLLSSSPESGRSSLSPSSSPHSYSSSSSPRASPPNALPEPQTREQPSIFPSPLPMLMPTLTSYPSAESSNAAQTSPSFHSTVIRRHHSHPHLFRFRAPSLPHPYSLPPSYHSSPALLARNGSVLRLSPAASGIGSSFSPSLAPVSISTSPPGTGDVLTSTTVREAAAEQSPEYESINVPGHRRPQVLGATSSTSLPPASIASASVTPSSLPSSHFSPPFSHIPQSHPGPRSRPASIASVSNPGLSLAPFPGRTSHVPRATPSARAAAPPPPTTALDSRRHIKISILLKPGPPNFFQLNPARTSIPRLLRLFAEHKKVDGSHFCYFFKGQNISHLQDRAEILGIRPGDQILALRRAVIRVVNARDGKLLCELRPAPDTEIGGEVVRRTVAAAAKMEHERIHLRYEGYYLQPTDTPASLSLDDEVDTLEAVISLPGDYRGHILHR